MRHPLTDVVLGYVTFTYGKDKEGEIEITNYGSSLEPWHLQMGATTKQYDPLQSGQFGEGLKRAIVTFRRKPNHHTFRIVSSNYNWSFGWDINGMLNLNLFKIEPQKIENERQKNISKPRSTWQFRRFEEGVSIIIGQKHLKYSKSDTKEYTGNKIRLGDFEIMVKSSSIVLERPESFETPVGSIILSSEYGNKLFSDGLSVRRIDQNRVPFLYGYDLHNAPSAQDRTFLRDPTELTTAVNNIWAHACRMEPKMVIRYTELIVNNINNLPDVSLDPTSDGLPLDVARLVWAELLSRKPPTKGGLAPFYYVEIGNSEVTTNRHLGKARPPLLTLFRIPF